MVFKRVAGSTSSGSGDAPNEVYCLLTSQRGLSRRCRAAWFLQRLGEELEEGLEERDWQLLAVTGDNNIVTPDTLVLFLVCSYSFVFMVDMSPSMAAVSNTTNQVNFDQVYVALKDCLQSLCQPFTLTEGGRIIVPNIYISVLAHTARIKPVEVLVQGAHVSHANVEELLAQLLTKLHHLENDIAATGGADNVIAEEAVLGGSEKKLGDTSLEGMLKAGNLAVHLLPYSSIKGVILVTDGVCGFVGAGIMNTLVGQMRRSNISCWALLVGGNPSPICCYGLVPDVDTLSFICTACNGCVMIYGEQDNGSHEKAAADSFNRSNGPNPYHRSILMWSFQLTEYHNYQGDGDKKIDVFQAVACPEGRQHHRTITMATPFLSVVGSRLRDGYYIDTVNLTNSQIVILLKQPWQPGITMEYSVTTTWPLEMSHNQVTVSIGYKGPYTFLHEVRRELSQPQSNLPVYRSLSLKRFKQSLHSLLTADQLLVHSWMFSTHSYCTAIPLSAREGMPLFYMSPNENIPVLSEGMTLEKSKKSKEGQFVTYWKQICSMDVKHWQKWLHLERISVALHSDCQLPKYLLIPNPNTGRYSPFQCRVAAAQLFSFLKRWSSVVLLENLCYVRFLPLSGEPRPPEGSKFCIIRVGQKPHRMLLNIGFLEGTNNQWREEVMTSLEDGLAALILSGGTLDNASGGKRKKIITLLPPKAHTVSMTVFKKPLQRLLISHEATPGSVTDGDKTMIQNYLIHYKWVWHFPTQLSFSKISLALLRERLHEGFHITSTHNGHVSLCVELSMKQSDSLGGVALIQYVLLPEATPLSSSVSCELWVEPQKGHVISPPETLAYLLGASYDQISSHIHAVDKTIVSRIVTNQMLHKKSLPTSDHVISTASSTPDAITPGHHDINVQFDLPSLLCNSRCLVMMISAFCRNQGNNVSAVSPINAQFHEHFIERLQEMCYDQITLQQGDFLLERLSRSIELDNFFSICNLDNQCKLLHEDKHWKCFVRKMDQRKLHLIFVPSVFISVPSNQSIVAKILPIIVTECSRQLLMRPDPMQLSPPTLQSDVFQQILFQPAVDTLHSISTPASPGMLFGTDGLQLSTTCSQLRNIHSQCFLDAMYVTLKCGLDDIVPSDFLVVTELCEKKSSSLDITPFIATLCVHSVISNAQQSCSNDSSKERDGSVESPTQASNVDYTEMIKLLRSQDASSITLSLATMETGSLLRPASQPCVRWGSELQQQLQKMLSQAHYHTVPGTSGYYYFSIIPPQDNSKQVNDNNDDGGNSSHHSDESDTMLPEMMFDEERASSETHLPLFLGISCYITNTVTKDEVDGATTNTLPTCLKTLLGNAVVEPEKSDTYAITMEITSYITPPQQPLTTPTSRLRAQSGLSPSEGKSLSIDPPYPGNELATEFPSTDEVFENSGSGDLVLDLPPVQRKSISLVQEWLLWLFVDEMISLACENDYMTHPLILAISDHINHGYRNFYQSCSYKELPLKFVFGSNRCFNRFRTEFESLMIDGYQLKQRSDWYYLMPQSHNHLAKKKVSATLSCEMIMTDDQMRRESFPTKQQQPMFQRSHRRAVSCTAVVSPNRHMSGDYTSQISQPVSPSCSSQARPSISHYSSLGSLLSKGEVCSGYDASQSNSATSLSTTSGTPAVRQCCPVGEGSVERFWLLMQVSEELVKVLFHTRCSRVSDKDMNDKMSDLYEEVITIISDKCRKVNQFYLLQDMMDTRQCSPLILPDSASGAWVDENFSPSNARLEAVSYSEFRASQFACQSQWCHQIPLHWRLKESLKVSTAQNIARAALDAFHLINRDNVFVVQEIDPELQESIYYLRIHESLCSMEEEGLSGGVADTTSQYNLNDATTKDTMATTEDSLESDLVPPSSAEIHKDENIASNQGQLRESLVLELHGISTPSKKLKEHLIGLITRKLDDKVLEIMCTYHARNRTLNLVPEDVQFLQPSGATPTHSLYFSVPALLHDYAQPLSFYFLQNMSTFCLKPKYKSENVQNYFQLPSDIMKMMDDVSLDILYDHTSLYLRPLTKGRGMAVLSVVLLDDDGQYRPFCPGVVMPTIVTEWSETSFKHMMDQVSSTTEKPDGPSLCVYVWEKGNIGFAELRSLLTKCFNHSVIDSLMELFLLPSPIATILGEEEDEEDEMDDSSMLDEPFDDTPIAMLSVTATTPVQRQTSQPIRSRHEPSVTATTPVERQTSQPIRSRHDTFSIIKAVEDAIGTPPDYNVAVEGQIAGLQEMRVKDKEPRVPPSELSWQQKEKERRIHEEHRMRHKQAAHGELGQLALTFDKLLLPVLSHASQLASPSLTHFNLHLPAHYMMKDFLKDLLQSMTQLAQLQVNVFCRQGEGGTALHYLANFKPLKSKFLRKNSISSSASSIYEPLPFVNNNYLILVGRNVEQWEESCDPLNKEIHQSLPCMDNHNKRSLQLFQPLDSAKIINTPKWIPLTYYASMKPTFVPRQRLVYMTIEGLEANLYLYNTSDELAMIFKKHINKVLSWQQKRAGLMDHILSQKMGLYYHTSASDIAPNTKEASSYCKAIQDVGLLAKCSIPPSKELEQKRLETLKHQPADQTVLERFYFNQTPLKIVDNPSVGDKAYRHANQFKETWIHVHRQSESIQLLTKVFATWQQKKMDEAPVASNKVASLKRMSRLLHYCTTPLMVECLKPHSMVTTTTNEEVVIVDTPSTEWQDSLCSEFLSKYCDYLKSLNFLQINESAPLAVSPRRTRKLQNNNKKAPTVKPDEDPELYQCFQRSWPGGIMLVDLTFLHKKTFCVKLFSLESSRLEKGMFPSVSPKVSERFSAECAKLKDFTHVHSFTYDFHLQYLRTLLTSPSHAVDVLLFLESFTKQFSRPPHYIRNRIAKAELSVSVSGGTIPLELYKHILANSAEFNMTTIEGRPNLSASQLPPHHLCLLLDISPENLGVTTEVCFTNLLQVTQHQYEVMLLLAYKDGGQQQHQPQQKSSLDLMLYLILLNKYEEFPRLSHFQLATPSPSPSPEPLNVDDEDLHISVQRKRRSLGYESLYSPSSASQVVINDHMITEQIDSLKAHLGKLVHKASYHMTRERLWKRLLYGTQLASASDRNKKMGLEKLTCSEFCSLLSLVKVCPLDTLDSRLTVFNKMSRSWYTNLISILQAKFDANFRSYSTEDGKKLYAAIINPNWQDMFVLVQSGTSERDHTGKHGLSAVYRKRREGGGLPVQQRDITAHIEDDRDHIENIINFVCSYLWSKMILDSK